MSETPLEERIGRALHSASGANTDWNEERVRWREPVPVQQEPSVRAPKTDDPHSLPRVDDLLDDIPVQQEPGRYSDRERVADYLASAQGVEFHDLNDDAQREWLMRASDALRAVWSIGRLVDADDGYEVMCEPVAAMVEEVRAALVPVQQDEPEAWAATENFDPQPGDFLFGSDGQAYMFRKGGWHRYPERDRAATGTTEYSPTVPVQQDEPEADSEFFEKGETGEPPTEEELAFIRESAEDVYESGLPDIEAVPVQQEPERSALGSDEDFRNAVKAYPPLAVPSVGLRDRVACELANLEYERSGRLCETEDFYADADRVLSVHEAGTQGDWQQARTVRHLLDRIIDGSMANGPTDEDINSAESVTGWIAVASPGPAEAGTQEGENA